MDAKPVLASLPNLPGVYRMLNAKGEALYVGKARDLKKRVSSYFQKTAQSPRTQVMLGQVEAIETTVTRSEAEALILENNLIKTLTPRYNIMFRDDKSYPYIMLTGHQYPQIRFYRGSFDKKHSYYGPYATAWAVRDTIGVLQKVFRLRTCEDTVFANRSRPCLLHQIRRCSAPCVGAIAAEVYAQDVANAKLFLEGKPEQVLESLNEKMQSAAQVQRYEDAAGYRDQIEALRRVLTKQYVVSESSRDADIIALDVAGAQPCVNLVMVRGGRHLGDKTLFPANAEGSPPEEVLEAFLTQHYSDKPIPPLLLCNLEDGAVAEWQEALESALAEQARHPVRINFHPAGEWRNWLNMALENARLARAQRLASENAQGGRLEALREVLQLPAHAQRIECFDVSHTMGEATVAACVVFDHGKLQTSEYRHYNMREVKAGDDYGAMREVLTRRYRKLAEAEMEGEGESKRPDLILIDGGKGQVNAAFEVLADLGLGDVALVGVAKGEARKPGLEQLVFAAKEQNLQLAPDHPALHLIQQIRDEAHRFAITGHRQRRGKARVKSSLEDIPGVGARRRQKLLARFGGLRGVLAASVDDLAAVEGISRALAEKIYQQLH